MGQYDTELKQLMKVSATAVLRQVAGAEIVIERWVETELRKTEYRQADLLGLTHDGQPVQIELQSTNDPKMPLRMAEYAVAICRQFDRLPKQVVLYFGAKKLTMSNELRGPDNDRPDFACRYTLVDFRDVPGGPLLASDQIEENVLALLARMQDQAGAIRQILERIATLDEPARLSAFDQLLILSGLRSLETTIKAEVAKMPILDDIMDHKILGPAIRQGREEGREKGREEGREKGREEGREKGREEGRELGKRELLLTQIAQRFGPIESDIHSRLESLTAAEIDALGLRLFGARSLDDLFIHQ